MIWIFLKLNCESSTSEKEILMLLQRKTKAAAVQSRSRPRTYSSGALGVIKLLLFSGVKLSSAIKQVQERSRTHTKVNCSIWWWEINSPWKQRGKIEHSVLLRSCWWLQWKVVKTSAKFFFSGLLLKVQQIHLLLKMLLLVTWWWAKTCLQW